MILPEREVGAVIKPGLRAPRVVLDEDIPDCPIARSCWIPFDIALACALGRYRILDKLCTDSLIARANPDALDSKDFFVR